jgi:hypothetical protein
LQVAPAAQLQLFGGWHVGPPQSLLVQSNSHAAPSRHVTSGHVALPLRHWKLQVDPASQMTFQPAQLSELSQSKLHVDPAVHKTLPLHSAPSFSQTKLQVLLVQVTLTLLH